MGVDGGFVVRVGVGVAVGVRLGVRGVGVVVGAGVGVVGKMYRRGSRSRIRWKG